MDERRRHRAAVWLLIGIAIGGCSPTAAASPVVAPTPVVAPSPTMTASPALLTRDQAVAAARLASDMFADGDVLQAEIGPYSKFTSEYTVKSSPIPRSDAMVWWISLGTDPGPLMGQGEFFVVDATDGHVVEHYSWIS
jgi:hypothetical protein